jgi:uncharacterized membrane protein
MGQYIYLIYAAISIIVVALVIVFGVGQGSSFVPQDKDVEQEKRWESKTKNETGKEGGADVSTS